MMQLLSLLLLFTAQFCSIATAKFGLCKNHKVQENFTMSEYLGTWYEIERSGSTNSNTRCNKERYSVDDENKIELLTQYVQKDDTLSIHKGDIFYSQHEKSKAKFFFRITNEFDRWGSYAWGSLDHFVLPYWVLATDYTSYSLVLSCSSALITHHDYIWILGRERQLPKNVTDYLHEILIASDIDVKLVPTDQHNCTVVY
ncbi:apolipoprotein D-like isoform X1 [Hypanus sabinus]|uniref:apolipoprotein D-like isoform X1 n=1 Tax=Hypanus sabinus TaxID=79690 RepID=UPI0028C38A34|nr:apolipoprotein D-like isoform X1 [Hypanus sabinus]XP_059844708.1 apolipoprotein D-like isoform X1 [Hypanus sabinus]